MLFKLAVCACACTYYYWISFLAFSYPSDFVLSPPALDWRVCLFVQKGLSILENELSRSTFIIPRCRCHIVNNFPSISFAVRVCICFSSICAQKEAGIKREKYPGGDLCSETKGESSKRHPESFAPSHQGLTFPSADLLSSILPASLRILPAAFAAKLNSCVFYITFLRPGPLHDLSSLTVAYTINNQTRLCANLHHTHIFCT